MRDVIFEDDSISLTVLPLNGAVLVRRTQVTGVGNRRVKSELTLTQAELDALCEWWTKKRAKEAK